MYASESDASSDEAFEDTNLNIDQDSVYGFSDNSDDLNDDRNEIENVFEDEHYDEEEDEDVFDNIHEIKTKKQEMDSDLDEDENDYIPSVHAWGSKVKNYIGTDYVDKDLKKLTEKERILAETEENEGKEIQKRLIGNLVESAIDVDFFDESIEQKIDLDDFKLKNVNLLTDEEKIDYLQKQSPEFFILKQDFVNYSKEFKLMENFFDKFDLNENKFVQAKNFYNFVETKYNLIQRYCMNICFYMYLKTKGINTNNHLIKSTLKIYRKLCKQMDSYQEEQSFTDLNSILLDLENNCFKNDLLTQPIDKVNEKNQINKRKIENNNLKGKRVKFIDEIQAEKNNSNELSKPESKPKSSLEDNNEVVGGEEEYYSDEYQDEKQVLFVHKRENVPKRKISKMIEKNRGLIPYRKKDYRNPRVRYKNKFVKAEIKRKSQVKEPIKEIKKYEGEYHGIKSDIVRSVKFK